MPRVPVIDGPSVGSNALPAPQFSGAGPAAFGAGFGEAIAGGGGALAQIAFHHQENANAARIIAEIKPLDDIEHDLMWNGPDAALNTQGRNALPVYEKTLAEYDRQTAELVNGLANPKQKQLLGHLISQRRSQIGNRLEVHTKQQLDQAEAAESQAAIQSTAALGVQYYDQPERLAQQVALGDGVIASYAHAHGLGEETAAKLLSDFHTQVHGGVVERFLSNGQAGQARDYLAAHKEEIAGDRVADLEKAVQRGTTLGDAYAQSDAIIASSANPAEARKAVAKIDDPEVREAADQLVSRHYQQQEQDQRIAENQLFDHWSDRLETLHGNITRLKREMTDTNWQALDQNSRVALEGRAKQINEGAAGAPPQTDMAHWTDFTLMTPEQKAAITNPMKTLRPFMSDNDYQQAVDRIEAARKGLTDASALAHERQVQDDQEFITTTLQGAGIIPWEAKNWKDGNRLALKRAFDNYQAQSGEYTKRYNRQPTAQERKGMVDELIKTHLQTVPTGFFAKLDRAIFGTDFGSNGGGTGSPVPIGILSTDDAGNYMVPADSVPGFNRARIENLTGTMGWKVDDEKIGRAYAAGLLGADEATVGAILKGSEVTPAELADLRRLQAALARP